MNVLIRVHQTKILSKATYQSTRRGEQNKQQKKQRDHSSQQASTPLKNKTRRKNRTTDRNNKTTPTAYPLLPENRGTKIISKINLQDSTTTRKINMVKFSSDPHSTTTIEL
jgi:hypothetical protein